MLYPISGVNMMNLNSPFRSVSDAIQKVIVPFAAKQKDRRSDLL